ncbi:MAG TPA: FAD-dependent oxidoreductase [Saprospiraceae bacterium]|nr:FAD-dependent oxidoreductase [Saprospiraceae bacterium]
MQQDFSFWEFETYSREWDICIIGNGITGLSTGISLLEKEPSLQVLVVDQWFIPLGASTRNAGFCCFGSPSEILDDIARVGEANAVSLVRKRWQGLLRLRARIDNSFAQYETNGGYELFKYPAFEKIADRLDYLNQLLADVFDVPLVFRQTEVPQGIKGFSHAVYNSLDGQLHPGFMMEDLKNKYLALGGKMRTGYPVDAIEEHDDYVQLLNHLALPITARKVIVTTNAFAFKLLPQLDVHGARNHVLVTNPIPGLSWKGCFHYDKGFYYFRNIGNRILLGGARNTDIENEYTEEFGFNPKIFDALHQFLDDHLADRAQYKIEYQWSGVIGIGSVKHPIIQALSPRLFVGVRLSGMGIALASLIGEELTQIVLQQE